MERHWNFWGGRGLNVKCFKGKNTMLNYLEFPVEWIKPKNPMGRGTDILWKSILSTKVIYFFLICVIAICLPGLQLSFLKLINIS